MRRAQRSPASRRCPQVTVLPKKIASPSRAAAASLAHLMLEEGAVGRRRRWPRRDSSQLASTLMKDSRMTKYKLEYIWLDGYTPTPNLRGKTQITAYDSFPSLEDPDFSIQRLYVCH